MVVQYHILSLFKINLIVASLFISIPVTRYLMNLWLESYAYRIKIGPSLFIITGASILVIKVFTLGYHSLRAALRNPVISLRYE